MKTITVSEITRMHGSARYFCPFFSWGQFVSALAFFSGGLLVGGLVIVYLANPDSLWQSLAGGVVGGMYLGVYRCMPARMTLTTRGEARYFLRSLEKEVLARGYVLLRSSPPRFRYENRAPRWLRWKEQEVELVVRDHEIEVNGPVAALESLQRCVQRSGLSS